MAIDKAVDSSQLNADLKAIADAIRSKGGTSGLLEFPGGFADAIAAIQTGGGGGDNEMLTALLTNTLTDFVAPKEITSYRNYVFHSATALKTADLRNLTTKLSSGMFYNCTSLESVILPEQFSGYPQFGGSVFYDCKKLKEIEYNGSGVIPSGSSSVFQNCTSLTRVWCPNFGFNSGSVFRGCSALELIAMATNDLWNSYFNGCSVLKTLVLTNTSLVTLAATNNFTGTPFAEGGAGGTVYVPSALIESYKTATNWSTLYAAGTVTFLPIEGSEYE